MLISEKIMYFCKHEDINLAHEFIVSVAAKASLCMTWPRGYKTFFMLNSAEQEI